VSAVALEHTDTELITRLRARDAAAFEAVVAAYGAPLHRLAAGIVGSRAVAEEVVQDTWVAVFSGVDRFERRASFKTWLFRIVTNLAKSRAARERRSVPLSALAATDEHPTVEIERFLGPGTDSPGRWASAPTRWSELPEDRLHARETLSATAAAIASLPPAQRAVITRRHVEGRTAEEVCEELGISDGNQRVLLHRACARVRRVLEEELGGGA
jgi:RNA polymerase sigma-70 factor, ECF subfamily